MPNEGLHRLVVLYAIAAAFVPQEISAAESVNYSILYTGRLFGYFRYPNVQPVDQQGCPAGAVASLPAQTFLDSAEQRKSSELRVAMGDNFAPEVLSVKMYDQNPAPGAAGLFRSRIFYVPYLDKAANETKWWPRGHTLPANGSPYPVLLGMLPSDAVGCFLQKAQFQALVPGKDDFYFGPDYVSNVARFLHQEHGSQFPRVEMLGANLIVSTVERNAAKPLPPDELPLEVRKALLSPRPSDPGDALTVTLPEDVLPWLREVEVKIPQAMEKSGYIADLCLAAGDDPNDCLTSAKPHKGLTKTSEPLAFKPKGDAKDRKFVVQLGTDSLLLPDRNYAFCVRWPKEKPADKSRDSYCKTFTVRQPLLQAIDPKTMAIESGSPAPYYISKDGPPVVVFGVVDKSLMQEVGLLNYSWWNDNSKFDTTVKTIDPSKALQQLLSMCDHDSACQGRRKILLAEMTPQKARDLIAELQKPDDPNIFDVVLTQVDPRDYTGTITLSVNRGHHDEDANGPLFLVPAAHYEYPPKNDNLSIKLQRAALSFDVGVHEDTKVSLANTVQKEDLKGEPVSEVDRFEKAVNDEVDKLPLAMKTGGPKTANKKDESKTPFESLALARMREYCNADLAVMQPRDVFEKFRGAVALWSRPDGNNIPRDVLFSNENLMAEVLWKGDVVICRALSGADLKKALQQSEGGTAELTKLVYLGVEKDSLRDNYIVAGQAVDEKRLYSVALTDFLAFGDTGYKDLNATDVGTADTIRSTKKYTLVADAALEGVQGQGKVATVLTSKLYDHVPDKPPLSTPRFDELQQLRDWTEHWVKAYSFTPILGTSKEPEADPLQIAVQNRGYNFFNLEKLTVGYALTAIEGPQQLAPVKFGGISNVPQLQTLESQSVTLWERLRFGHVFPKWVDIFGLGEARYGFSRTRQTATAAGYDPYKINITENGIQLETGFLTKRISETIPFRFLLSERLSTQLRAPLLSYSAPALAPPASTAPTNCQVTSIDSPPPVTATSSSNILCAAPRSFLQQTKIGTRLENQDNWIEFGWETGHNFDSVTGYILNKGTAAELDCSATTNQSVTSCITKAASKSVTALSPLYVTQQTLPVSGWFLNFKIAAPLYAKTVQFSIENYSEVFLKHSQDTSADTRFYQDTVLSLPVKLWQNLSIAPQVEIFNYQNKVLPQHFLSLASKLTLDYNFDWHSGLSASRAVAFPDAATVTKGSTLPAP